MEKQAVIAPRTTCFSSSATYSPTAGLCRAENRSCRFFKAKSHTARHNPVPGIIPIMPLPA
jgi:hypothetical protein